MIRSYLGQIKRLFPQRLINIYHFFVALFSVVYFGYSARNLTVVGVTGTDGKTTTATLIYQFLKSSGFKVALVSTVSAYIGADKIDTGFHVTAPDPWMLQKLLKRIRDKGFEYVVLEATSHGLDQHRLLGSNIKVAVLTNITHEHLDYHKTYDNYVSAKSKIFKGVDLAIINKTDGSYKKVIKHISSNTKIISYDLKSASLNVKKSIFKRFPENYNRLNAIAAYLAASYLGAKDSEIITALKKFEGVEGRMEEVNNDRGIRTIVDFAHTPNALEKVLTALKPQVPKGKKLIAVFGCASERDIGKRPMMGEISTRLANISVFTSEDPRNEDPKIIIDQIIKGAVKNKGNNKYYSVPDRAEAIDLAVNKFAKKGDIVVVCGKGHEKSMNIGGVELPWSDKKVLLKALRST